MTYPQDYQPPRQVPPGFSPQADQVLYGQPGQYPQGQQPQYFGPPSDEAPRRRPAGTPWYRKAWVVGVASFLLGGAFGSALSGSSTPAATAAYPAKTAAAKAPAVAAPKASTKAAPAKPAPVTIEGTGTYIVGEDIKPGTYKTTGGELCYWARLRSTEGGLDAIIANHLGAGRQVVTIKATDKAFETTNCETWAKA